MYNYNTELNIYDTATAVAAQQQDQDNEEQHNHHHPEVVILAPFILLGVGALLRHTTKSLPLPYTMQLLVLGSILGFMLRLNDNWDDPFQRSVEILGNMDPHLMLHIFLPPLIFESAASLEWHTFAKSKWYIFALAGPGLLLASGLTGIVINLLLERQDDVFGLDVTEGGDIGGIGGGVPCPDGRWSWKAGLMLGVIMSATDPVAVVALLKDLGCHASLSTKIEGESLLNDGTALVIFTILVKMVEGDNSDGWDDYIWMFVKMSFGGALFGITFAFVMVKWLGSIFNDALAEITITVSGAYLCFFVAEYFLHVSGVIAVVCLGLFFGRVGKTSVSPEVFHFLEEFWELLAYFGNTLIFVVAGTVIGYKLPLMPAKDFGMIGFMYAACTLIRAIVVGIVYVIFNLFGAGLSRNDQVIAIWGGLRGAVGLSLAMMVFSNEKICSPIRDQVMFHTAGIVVLTVIINSSSMPKVVSLVGLDKVGPSKQLIYDQAVENILRAGKKQELNLRSDHVFDSTVWDEARKYFFLVPSRKELGVAGTGRGRRTLLDCIYDAKEARRRALMIAKQSYWKQFKDGLLSNASVQYLLHHTDLAIDDNCHLNEWETYSKLVEFNSTIHKLMHKQDVEVQTRRHKILKFLDCVPVLIAILILTILSCILSFTLDPDSLTYMIFDLIITAIFFIELCVRLYCMDDWHSFAVDPYVIIDTIVVLLDIVLLGAGDILGIFSGYTRVIRAFRFMRLVRILRVARLAKKLRHTKIAAVHDTSNLWGGGGGDGVRRGSDTSFSSDDRGGGRRRKTNAILSVADDFLKRYRRRILFSHLKHGYEVATGFKVAREEILVTFKHLVGDPSSPSNGDSIDSKSNIDTANFHDIHSGIEKDLKAVQTVLLDMQRLYSEIAASITTAVAARTVLNKQRHTIKDLYNHGMLEINEFNKMTGSIEFHMKRLVYHPPLIAMPRKKDLLGQIQWLEFLDKDDGGFLDRITDCFEDAVFQRGDMLVKQNDDTDDSVHVLARGTVKVVLDTGDGLAIEVDELGMGSVFGEIGWALGINRGASIVATSPGLLFTISGPKLRELAEENKELNMRLWDTCGRRVSENLLAIHLEEKGLSRREVRDYVHEMEIYNVDVSKKVMNFNTSGSVVLLRGTGTIFHETTNFPTLLTGPCILESNKTNCIFRVQFSTDAKFMCHPNVVISSSKNEQISLQQQKSNPSNIKWISSMEYKTTATSRRRLSSILFEKERTEHAAAAEAAAAVSKIIPPTTDAIPELIPGLSTHDCDGTSSRLGPKLLTSSTPSRRQFESMVTFNNQQRNDDNDDSDQQQYNGKNNNGNEDETRDLSDVI